MNLQRAVAVIAALVVAVVGLCACARADRPADQPAVLSGGTTEDATPAPPIVSSTDLSLPSSAGLSIADVDRLFQDWSTLDASELEEADLDPYAAFRDMVLRTVDFRSWAEDEASSMPRNRWLKGEPIDLEGKAKSATIADALVVYDKIRAEQGASAAYDAVVTAWDAVEHDPQPDPDDELLFVLAPDLALLSFMTEPPRYHGTRPHVDWSWRLTDVSIEGSDVARIRFTAKSYPEAAWSFSDPSRVYEKVWRFSYDPGLQRWLLSSWPNRGEFIDTVRTNLLDPTNALCLDSQPFWWLIG